jgi:general secretion pathway protein H
MPTSAIGNKADAGFTLVEALTTLFVIALVAGAAMLVLPGPERETRAFAERFAARLALASDESVIANRQVALVMNAQGYGFARLEDTGWRDISAGSPLAFRPWPRELEAHVENAETSAPAQAVRFDPAGGATPARILLATPGSSWRVEVDGQGRPHVSRAQ